MKNDFFLIWSFALHKDLRDFYTSSRWTKAQLLTFLELYSDNSLCLPQANRELHRRGRQEFSVRGLWGISFYQILRLIYFRKKATIHLGVCVLLGTRQCLYTQGCVHIYNSITMWPTELAKWLDLGPHALELLFIRIPARLSSALELHSIGRI